MFEIGSKIVYPMHGAGIITNIEDREILGETRRYYCVSLPCGRMTASVPVDKAEGLGIRDVIDSSEIGDVLAVLEQPPEPMQSNWNRRYRANIEKLQTGDIHIVASVVRDLAKTDKVKPLSTGEKKLLGTAKQIVASELVYAGGFTMEEAEMLVESHI